MAGSEKTEKATPKKRKDERKKGNTFQSQDVVSVVLLFMAFFMLNLMVPFIYQQLKKNYHGQMDKVASMDTLTVTSVGQLFREAALVYFVSVLPVAVVIMIIAIIMSGVQTGFLVAADGLKPKFNRINPLSGIKRMVSIRSVVELLKSMAKVALIIGVIYTTILSIIPMTPDMLATKLDANLIFMNDQIISMVQTVCLIFSVVAILDYAYQRYDYEKKLKMTKQEVKDEYKQTEGNPEIKGKIRQKQREMSMSRMMQMVPQADVIVRNPTHYAVALKYDMDHDVAPLVLAKGKDHIAMRIVSVAAENKILIKENKALARGLYESVEINDYIPAELYKAVAELMAWVYSNKKKETVK
ncbi:flagellar biosynthesis protein FlhB [uncultured Acetobacterium sp.]|uniref:flagellar biosynthesis protein FlhB n=1 Tax=uncultured Acetobacterium sp. TaxID=217139 RepID=UPI0025D6A318|nr:flagellar biosynthesis protein FlhB [uncultured Acetobacterium sp.]